MKENLIKSIVYVTKTGARYMAIGFGFGAGFGAVVTAMAFGLGTLGAYLISSGIML